MSKTYLYKPLAKRSRLLIRAALWCIFVWSAAVAGGIFVFAVFRNIKNLNYTTEESLEFVLALNELAAVIIGGLQILSGLFLVIVFLCWQYRACANMWAWNIPEISQKPAWGFWNYILPVWSLFKPHTFLREIWHAPRWQDYDTPSAWKFLPAPKILNWYWGLFIGGRIVEKTAEYMDRKHPDPLIDDLILQNILATAADVIGLITIILLIKMVKGIELRHSAYAQKLADSTDVSR